MSVLDKLVPFYSQIKAGLAVVAFLGWTWAVYDITKTYSEVEKLETVASQQAETIKSQKASEGDSFDAGAKYAKKRAAIQRVVNTPDRTLDEELQGPAGDVVLPGSLGVRLNSIASVRASGQAASSASGALR